jgi:hypothetical protein
MATYMQLKNGSWGIKVRGEAVETGQSVRVEKKSGEVQVVTVARVLWQSDDQQTAICAISRSAAGGRRGGEPSEYRRRARRTGCSCGSVEGEVRDTDCWTCQHDAL